MSILGLFILVWLVSAIYNSQSKRGKSVRPGGVWRLLLASVFLIVFLVTDWTTSTTVTIINLVSIVLLFPSIILQVTTRLGLVRISFVIGHLTLVRFNADMKSAPIYFAYFALARINNEQSKSKAHQWILKRASFKKSQLLSGSMLMRTLVRNFNLPPDELANKLYYLRGIDTRTLPPAVKRLISKVVLLPGLIEQDWKKIDMATSFWGPKQPATLHKWISMFKQKQLGFFGTLKKYYYWLLIGAPLWGKFIPTYVEVDFEDNTEGLSLHEKYLRAIWHWNQTGRQEKQYVSKLHWKLLPSPEIKNALTQRAESLNCFSAESAIDNVYRSVRRQWEIVNPSSAESDEKFAEKDKLLSRLSLISSSISNRLNSNSSMPVTVEFDEWLSISEIMQQLIEKHNAHADAFGVIGDICWNWMADLWNNREQRAFSTLICQRLLPIAETLKYEEARSAFNHVLEMYRPTGWVFRD